MTQATHPTQHQIDQIIGKLAAHDLTIDSDWQSIIDCLSQTVMPTHCIRVATWLRNETRYDADGYDRNGRDRAGFNRDGIRPYYFGEETNYAN